jgi:hypothetical protein
MLVTDLVAVVAVLVVSSNISNSDSVCGHSKVETVIRTIIN